MKVLRFDSPTWMTELASQIPPNVPVTVIHLGRGGVMSDGTLDEYNQDRAFYTTAIAFDVVELYARTTVKVIWTGGCNREQDRSGVRPAATEAEAALNYIVSELSQDGESVMNLGFTMETETLSTSTVENATRSSKMIGKDDVIIVVSDPLHYVGRKVQFIMKLVFPRRRLVFAKLPASPPGTDHWLIVATHLVSTLITRIGMIGVRRGDADAIQRRQNLLQRLTGH